MTCNTNIPLTDIVEAVIDKLDLDQFAKAVGGVLTDPTFKGSITLDKKAKESLCAALTSCLDDAITNFSLSGDDLTIVTADGSVHTVSLEKYMTDADAKRMADALKAQIKDDFLRLNLGNGLTLTPDGKLTLNLGEGLTIKDGKVIIDDDGICTQVTKAVNNYTVLPTDEILTSSGGTITFPASIPVGKSYTVIQTGDSEVKLVGHPNIHSVGGTTTLKGKNHAVTVIRGTSSDWFVYGGVRP